MHSAAMRVCRLAAVAARSPTAWQRRSARVARRYATAAPITAIATPCPKPAMPTFQPPVPWVPDPPAAPTPEASPSQAAAPAAVPAAPIPGLADLWQAYLHSLARHPLFTKAATSFFCVCLGDLIAQAIGGAPLSASRMLRLAAYSSTVGAATGHYWHRWLEAHVCPDSPTCNRSVRRAGVCGAGCLQEARPGHEDCCQFLALASRRRSPAPSAVVQVVTKMALDQLVLTPVMTAGGLGAALACMCMHACMRGSPAGNPSTMHPVGGRGCLGPSCRVHPGAGMPVHPPGCVAPHVPACSVLCGAKADGGAPRHHRAIHAGTPYLPPALLRLPACLLRPHRCLPAACGPAAACLCLPAAARCPSAAG